MVPMTMLLTTTAKAMETRSRPKRLTCRVDGNCLRVRRRLLRQLMLSAVKLREESQDGGLKERPRHGNLQRGHSGPT